MGRGPGEPNGTEFEELYQSGSVKYVRYRHTRSATVPRVTRTRNRIYATVNAQDKVKFITFYDKHGRLKKQIDVFGQQHLIDGESLRPPHVHIGYLHGNLGTRAMNAKEKKILARILRKWYNHRRRE